MRRQATKKLKSKYKTGDKLNKGEYFSKEYIFAKTEGTHLDETGQPVKVYKNLKIKCLGFFTSDQYIQSIEENIAEANKRLKSKVADKEDLRIEGNLVKKKTTAKRDCFRKAVASNVNQDLIFRYELELYGMKWM